MRENHFERIAVVHDGRSQVRKVLLAKEREWQLAELFGNRDAAAHTFVVHAAVSRTVRKPVNDKHHDKQDCSNSHIEQSSVRSFACKFTNAHLLHQKIKEHHHREHERNKVQECPDNATDKRAGAFFRKSKSILNPLIHFRLLHYPWNCRGSM